MPAFWQQEETRGGGGASSDIGFSGWTRHSGFDRIDSANTFSGSAGAADPKSSERRETGTMEWEVGLIEWLQKTLGSMNESVGKVLSFIGGEMGLLLVVLIVLFCWKKETGKRERSAKERCTKYPRQPYIKNNGRHSG